MLQGRGVAVGGVTPSSLIAPEIVAALAELKAEIGIDQRLRQVENHLSAVQATIAATQRPSQIPAVVSAVVAIISALVAVVALVNH